MKTIVIDSVDGVDVRLQGFARRISLSGPEIAIGGKKMFFTHVTEAMYRGEISIEAQRALYEKHRQKDS